MLVSPFPTPIQVQVKFRQSAWCVGKMKESHHRTPSFLARDQQACRGTISIFFTGRNFRQARHGHNGTSESYDEASSGSHLGKVTDFNCEIFGAPIFFASSEKEYWVLAIQIGSLRSQELPILWVRVWPLVLSWCLNTIDFCDDLG